MKFSVLTLVAVFSLPIPTHALINEESCGRCHSNPALYKTLASGEKLSLFVNIKAFRKSIHGTLSCEDCHKDASKIPHRKDLAAVTCGYCHDEEKQSYRQSVHGKAWARGEADVPTCTTCHGTHDIMPVQDPAAKVSRVNLTKVCLSCHTDERITGEHRLPGAQVIKAYEKSVHGMALMKKGLTAVAQCIDCHGTHNIKPADDPTSVIYKPNIPEVCAGCHQAVYAVYQTSIHGQAIKAGILDAPVCTDCHGEHTIATPFASDSKVSPANIPKTCAACHEAEKIVSKYGLATKRYTTYLDSYHGVMNKFGETVVANCASCHGVHNILPASNPKSSVNKANLPSTCGKCHPGAGKNFARGTIHVQATKESSLGVYYVRRFYTLFIGILVGCFIFYIAIEMYGTKRRRKSTIEEVNDDRR